jgi:predicted Rossmann fold nucleotide-binding protein DprA/Smf involved in DNA uptake
MVFRVLIILVLFVISTSPCLSQNRAKSSNLQNVRFVIEEFNKKMFGEFDHRAAIEKYMFKNQADEIDEKADMRSDFFEITKKEPIGEKDGYYYREFFFHLEIPFVQWILGRTTSYKHRNRIIVSDKYFEKYDKNSDRLILNLRPNKITNQQTSQTPCSRSNPIRI